VSPIVAEENAINRQFRRVFHESQVKVHQPVQGFLEEIRLRDSIYQQVLKAAQVPAALEQTPSQVCQDERVPGICAGLSGLFFPIGTVKCLGGRKSVPVE
jgi:hypothetical protein